MWRRGSGVRKTLYLAEGHDSMTSSALINSAQKIGSIRCALNYWFHYFYFVLLASPKK